MHNLPSGFDVYLVIVKTNCSASFCGLLRKVNFMNGQRQARTYVPEEEKKNDAKKNPLIRVEMHQASRPLPLFY